MSVSAILCRRLDELKRNPSPVFRRGVHLLLEEIDRHPEIQWDVALSRDALPVEIATCRADEAGPLDGARTVRSILCRVFGHRLMNPIAWNTLAVDGELAFHLWVRQCSRCRGYAHDLGVGLPFDGHHGKVRRLTLAVLHGMVDLRPALGSPYRA